MNANRTTLMDATFKHILTTCLRDSSLQPLVDYGKHLNAILPESERPPFRKQYLSLHNWLSAALQQPLPSTTPTNKGTVHHWNDLITEQIQTGTQWNAISEMPMAMRDILQTSRTVGGQLCAPHPAPLDPTPRHLRPSQLMRQFHCDTATAKTLQTMFTLLDADSTIVSAYAKDATQRSLPVVWLEVRRWAAVVMKEDTRARDALRHTFDALTDTDGTASHTTLASQPLFGSPLFSPEADQNESTDDTEITPELFQESTHYDTIAYHKIPQDNDPEPPQWTHPLVQKIASCDRAQLPQLKKQLWDFQRTGQMSHVAAGAIWLEAELTTLKKAPLFLRSAYGRLEQLNRRDLARLGQLIFKREHDLTSSERKLFWAAYKARKAILNPAAPLELQPIA